MNLTNLTEHKKNKEILTKVRKTRSMKNKFKGYTTNYNTSTSMEQINKYYLKRFAFTKTIKKKHLKFMLFTNIS